MFVRALSKIDVDAQQQYIENDIKPSRAILSDIDWPISYIQSFCGHFGQIAIVVISVSVSYRYLVGWFDIRCSENAYKYLKLKNFNPTFFDDSSMITDFHQNNVKYLSNSFCELFLCQDSSLQVRPTLESFGDSQCLQVVGTVDTSMMVYKITFFDMRALQNAFTYFNQLHTQGCKVFIAHSKRDMDQIIYESSGFPPSNFCY